MKKYLEIYDYFRGMIESGELKSGDKLPSVRKATELLQVSKTTVMNAYFALQADGYILATPKSGYYVTDYLPQTEAALEEAKQTNTPLFDLSSGDADEGSFDIALWQRYIKSALRQSERLRSYSEVQGEADLRAALSDYIREKRNILASPRRIVVGAGIHALLTVLCPLLKEYNKEKQTVSFPTESFLQGRALFDAFGFSVHTRDKDADIIYVSPSHMTAYGDVMPMTRRLELTEYSKANGSLVIEDDFDGDFVYGSRPTPTLYTLSRGTNVIYMGSFSNVLLPGIRISYMVLTQELAALFEKKKDTFAQTASKTEQLALCQYLRDGRMNAQTRKIRRLYTAKARSLYTALKVALPNAQTAYSENGVMVKLTARFYGEPSVFERNGLQVSIQGLQNNTIKLLLVPSSLKSEEIENAVSVLKRCLSE